VNKISIRFCPYSPLKVIPIASFSSSSPFNKADDEKEFEIRQVGEGEK
jgi:hypothetical protein